MQKPISKNILVFVLCILALAGCATVPMREALPTYSLNGTQYLSLVSLCNLKNIKWEYDTFSRTVELNKDGHKINLMLGERMVLVDGSPRSLRYPADIYQDMVVVPGQFKEEIIDVLFRASYDGRRPLRGVSAIKKVVIDPGHGGKDPGAIGRTGVREKDVVLDISKRLSRLLESHGVGVVMTRSIDKFIPLSSRVDIANRSGADIFLSIHANANRVRSLNGFEVYYISADKNDNSRALSAAKNIPLGLKSSCFASHSLNLKAILWDMVYTNNRAESIGLGRYLCRTMSRNLDINILGIKNARFQVLKGASMPALLVEVGFLSNTGEERKLKNSYYRQKIAESLAEGISDYGQDFVLAGAR